ncbi:translocation and assembly module TamA [Chitinivorax tropicus]|uniref:Translocation and assembly module TamA n=1 Tax=Chitinivorax tropicus TaxID=714531 RepID=A0A840MG73_9PROT|nr:autotransporter assembly complex family protein [Chitinivorax tropicus]MBB5018244.1 translocation and assembly module TamA [Chitinivorax tropicus]
MQGKRLRRIVWLWAGLVSTAWANDFSYRVEIDSPDSGLQSLLEQYLDVVRYRDSELMTPEQLRRLYRDMPKQAADLLATEGYLSPVFTPTLDDSRLPWRVSMKVEPGRPADITDVVISLVGPVLSEPDGEARQQRLIHGWPLKAGDRFRQTDWDAAKRHGLQGLLVDRFPAAHIRDSEAVIDPAKATANLRVVYDSGPRFTLGPLTVVGLKRYPRSLVDNLWAQSPGAPYDYTRITEFQSALQSTPYFDSVYVDVDTDPGHAEQAPVTVTVKEAPAQKIGVSLGYGTDKGIRTELDYRYNNLLDRGWLYRARVAVERTQRELETGIDFPRNERGYYDGVFIRSRQAESQGLSLSKVETGVSRTRTRNGIGLTYQLNYLTERSQLGEDRKINKALTAGYKWVRRDVDNVLDPRRGNVLEVQLAGAARGVLSDTSFVRGYARTALYWPLGKQFLLQARGEIGQVVSQDVSRVPLDWLFRAGGSGSVRGYAFESLGIQQEGGIAPGDVMATVSLELQRPVAHNWRAALFADAGNASQAWDGFTLKRGYGVGARYQSKVGLFALDLAYGEAVKKWRLHASLGIAF